MINSANVTKTDIKPSNGLIHAINRLILHQAYRRLAIANLVMAILDLE